MVFWLGMVFTRLRQCCHRESAITDPRNWMHDSAGADGNFRSILVTHTYMCSNPFTPLSAESPQTSLEMVFLGELVQKTS